MGHINILLIRHGESEQNQRTLTDRGIPDHAVNLTDNGRRQAEYAAEFLEKWYRNQNIKNKDIKMWVSPYQRTRETARVIRNFFPISDVHEDEMLTELQFGIFHNMTHAEIKQAFPAEYKRYELSKQYSGKYYARRPEGESPFDCEIRQKLFIDTLYRDFHKENRKENIIIVGHGAALTLFRKAMFHRSHEWYEQEPNPGNCSIQHLVLNVENGYNLDKGYIYGGPMTK